MVVNTFDLKCGLYKKNVVTKKFTIIISDLPFKKRIVSNFETDCNDSFGVRYTGCGGTYYYKV